ncbi:MAG: hypothetical protein CG441_428 [Methylococcaceae bacterium NSM2-1]|nr:MAG: hypothetical protein CG441_428 [Methylococcaceae bacterium NSM2-1]
MAIAMADYPMIGLGVKLGEVCNGVGFDQAIDVIAFLQSHVPAGTRRNFSQQCAAAIDLYDQAFSAGNQRTNSPPDLILYRYAADMAAR